MDPKDDRSRMLELMERMCCSGELGPADMCRRMMRSMGAMSDAQAHPAPEGGPTSDERGRSSEGETQRGCCGPRSPCGPKPP